MARFDEREEKDLLSQYLQEIARYPLLTPERERELGRRVQENDKAALEELVKANLRFVVQYAKRYRNPHVLFLDLINEGNIGLIHAAEKFDPEKNVKFITYAVWWIRQAILHALSEQGGAFRLPPKRANLMYRLEKSISTAMTAGQHIPTPEELATELGVTVREVQTLMRANTDNFSLSAEIGEDSHSELADVIEQTSIPSAEDAMQVQGRREELLVHMAELSPKERLVLTLRHGVSDNIPMRVSAVAEFLNRPSEAVASAIRQGTEKVCAKLDLSESELAVLLLNTNPNSGAWEEFWKLDDLAPGVARQIDGRRIEHLQTIRQHGEVQKAIEELTLEERTIMKLRYGILQDEELTLRDIGEILGLSRERVRQIESRAEAKCRRSVRRNG